MAVAEVIEKQDQTIKDKTIVQWYYQLMTVLLDCYNNFFLNLLMWHLLKSFTIMCISVCTEISTCHVRSQYNNPVLISARNKRVFFNVAMWSFHKLANCQELAGLLQLYWLGL